MLKLNFKPVAGAYDFVDGGNVAGCYDGGNVAGCYDGGKVAGGTIAVLSLGGGACYYLGTFRFDFITS